MWNNFAVRKKSLYIKKSQTNMDFEINCLARAKKREQKRVDTTIGTEK